MPPFSPSSYDEITAMVQAEIMEMAFTNNTNNDDNNIGQRQTYEDPAMQTSNLHTPSHLAGILSDVARTNAEFWVNQCVDAQPESKGGSRFPAKTASKTPKTELPLLPTPKALQTTKRGREDNSMEEQIPVRAGAGRWVIVHNIPHTVKRPDLQLLFGQLGWKSIRRRSSHAVVLLATADKAGRAVRELSGRTIHGSTITVQFDEDTAPPVPDDEGSSASKRVKLGEDSEIRGEARKKTLEVQIGNLSEDITADQVKELFVNLRL